MSNFKNRRRRLARIRTLIAGGLLLALPASTAYSQNPTGGTVVAGAAAISSSGSTLNVNASTNRSVINWQSFSVGAGNTANFNLPSASSAVLNRVVTPNNPSAIHGALNSNGNVFLVNPSGVLVGPSGVVNTNGFTASTFDVTNRQFMNGGPMDFGGNSNASIVNQGTINTGAGGAHFIANQFNNSGTINSAGGSITVGSGQSVTYNNGVTHVEASMATLQNGLSETASLINNSGTIRATGAVMSGGEVYLTNPNGRVLNSGNVVASRSVAMSAGQVNHLGSIDVSGAVGGNVSINANDVLVQGVVTASGVQGGGSVAVSGSSVDQFATIDASSTMGDGGNVSINATEAYTATTAGDINVSGTTGGNITIEGSGRIVTSADVMSVGSSGAGGKIDIASATKTSILGASIDASGSTDGGQIRIGGEFQGGRDLVTSELANSGQTLVSPGSEIVAAGGTGKGGTAIVWSDERTQFYGNVDVTGSPDNGGFVELSSSGTLVYDSTDGIQTGGGTVLLDPKNGVIVDAAPSGMNLIVFSLADNALIDTFDRFGSSVDLNNPGTLLAIGAVGDDGGSVARGSSGAVYLFELNPSDTSEPAVLQQIIRDGSNVGGGNTLALDPGSSFGRGVGMNGDGSILAVGADGVQPVNPGPLTDDSGAVFLFSLDPNDPAASSTLEQILQDDSPLAGGNVLDLVDTEDPDLQNSFVVLPNDLDERRVFVDRLGNDDFGSSVDLNDAGDRLAVGAAGFRIPYTYLFELNPDDLSQAADLAQRVDDPIGFDGSSSTSDFGAAVALNGIGDRLAVGASGNGDDGERVHLFNLNANTLATPATLAQTIQDGITLSDGSTFDLGATVNITGFGSGVDFDQSGNHLAIGADFTSAVFLFELNANNLAAAPDLSQSLRRDTVLGDGSLLNISGQDFGQDVAFSGDGDLLAVGRSGFFGPAGGRQASGGVYLFDLSSDPDGPILTEVLATTSSASTLPSPLDEFGRSIAMNSDATRLAVGTIDTAFGTEFGEVYLFDTSATDAAAAPSLAAVLTTGTAVSTPVGNEVIVLDEDDEFGSALAFDDVGNLLAIGARGDDGSMNVDNNSGAIYLFELDGSDLSATPSLPNVLRNETSLAGGGQLMFRDFSDFGGAIALTGDGMRMAAGAQGDDKVLLFEFGAANFGGEVTLANTLEDGSALAGGGTLDIPFAPIGNAVALNSAGDRLAVGEVNGAGGAVRLFELNPNDWSQAPTEPQQIRRDSVLADGSQLFLNGGWRFGTGLALDDAGNQLAVGQTDDFNSNKVFLFDLDPNDLSAAADLKQTIGEGTPLTNGDTFDAVFGDFGAAVALNGAGDRLAVGDPGANSFHIFSFGSSGFGGEVDLAQSLGELSALGDFSLTIGSGLGNQVALNGIGDRLAVESAKRVLLFDIDPDFGSAPQLANVLGDGTGLSDGRILELEGLDSDFGSGIAFNSVGDILAVGDETFNFFDDGAVFLFQLDPNDLSQTPIRANTLTRDTLRGGEFIGIEGLDYQSDDSFGRSVSLNAAGDVLVVGAAGKAHLISLDTDNLAANPVLFQTIEEGSALAGGGTFSLPASAVVGRTFGDAVAINRDSNRLAVSSPFAAGRNGDELQSGAVVIFGLDPTDLSAPPTLAHTLMDGTSLAGSFALALPEFEQFGTSIAFNADGSLLAIGAPNDEDFFSGEISGGGRVFLFDMNPNDVNTTPSINQIIGDGVSIDGVGTLSIQELDLFGSGVALNDSGSLLAVGSEGASAGPNAKPGIGTVSLIGFGGQTRSFGDLLFTDDPAETTFISPDQITSIINGGNDLTLQFNNDLTIKSSILATDAGSGVGQLSIATGRSVMIEPGVMIDTAGGSLSFSFNNDSAIPAQRDPGDAMFLMDGAEILTSGGTLFISGNDFNQEILGEPEITASVKILNGSRIDAGAGAVFLNGFGGTEAAVSISGDGTSVSSEIFLFLNGSGSVTNPNSIGVAITDGASVNGLSFGGVLISGRGTDTGVLVDNAVVTAESGGIDINGFGAGSTSVMGNDASAGVHVAGESSLMTTGDLTLRGTGIEADAISLSDSILSGFDTTLVAGDRQFNATNTTDVIRLASTSVASSPMGELRVYVPVQANFVASADSTLNGVSGPNLLDPSTALLNNSLGLGPDPDLSALPVGPYLGTASDNYAFYLSTIDLTPSLFVTALSGSSIYGDVPVNPGIQLTSGVLEDGDTIGSIGLTTNFDLTQFSPAGDYTLSVDATNLDSTYRLVGSADGMFTVMPADLQITAGTYSKTYGETFVFPENDFTVDGLVNGEMIGPVEFLSLGTRPTADVMDDPYAVGLNVSGAGSFNPLNYNISFTNGGLTVNPAPLTVDPLGQSKTYGDSMLDRTAFTASGLQNGETISEVAFVSPGVAATADTGQYDLAVSSIVAGSSDFSAGNYEVQFGSLGQGLVVVPAQLIITPDDQLKLLGVDFDFDGSEFAAAGLRNGDTVNRVDLASDGTSADAIEGTFPIVASNPIGSFKPSNYRIEFRNGDFIVRETPVIPATVIDTEKLVYDQFNRYIDFANTIGALTPTNVGTIGLGPAPTEPAMPLQESPGETAAREAGSNEDVYLENEIRVSSRD